ncbi:hypothetical protein R50072_21430 [Simiduia litorea]|uniref:HAD-IC family P-type ATPase n=1 Tax=Simiduia litorea TaxID=1435348 RepID=UPI0036F20E73
MFLSVDGNLAGLISVADAIKPTTAQAIAALHRAGLSVVVLTGDNTITAAAVAKSLNIDEFKAEVTPDDKLHYLKELQAKGHIVAMLAMMLMMRLHSLKQTLV